MIAEMKKQNVQKIKLRKHSKKKAIENTDKI